MNTDVKIHNIVKNDRCHIYWNEFAYGYRQWKVDFYKFDKLFQDSRVRYCCAVSLGSFMVSIIIYGN